MSVCFTVFQVFQASPLLYKNVTVPAGPVTTRIYWSCKNCIGLTFFSLTKQEKALLRFTDNINFYLFYLHLFQNIWGHS